VGHEISEEIVVYPAHPHAPDARPGNKVVGPVAALVDRTRDALQHV
jgi:hypothetical protein